MTRSFVGNLIKQNKYTTLKITVCLFYLDFSMNFMKSILNIGKIIANYYCIICIWMCSVKSLLPPLVPVLDMNNLHFDLLHMHLEFGENNYYCRHHVSSFQFCEQYCMWSL